VGFTVNYSKRNKHFFLVSPDLRKIPMPWIHSKFGREIFNNVDYEESPRSEYDLICVVRVHVERYEEGGAGGCPGQYLRNI
jgi:hypothetical protein